MGIYIKGISVSEIKTGAAGVLNIDDSVYFIRGENVILLPDHGALIDKGALYERTEEWEAQALAQVKEYSGGESCWEQAEYRKWATIIGERSAFKFDVADAPVVIPAERSEE